MTQTAIFGLGNPGLRLSRTKHNFGVWAIDSYAVKKKTIFKPGKGDYYYAKDENTLLVKLTKYMNDSGLSVKQVVKDFDISLENILVVYDDIDLPLGKIRFKEGGGDGGHNGVKSIIYYLGSNSFNRLKLGIATDENMRPSEEYVLKPFKKKYDDEVKLVIEESCSAIAFFIKNNIKATMNEFN